MLFSFFYYINFNTYFIDKNLILDVLNMLNFFLYIKYKYFNIVWLKIKYISFYVYFICIRFMMIEWNYNLLKFIKDKDYIWKLNYWKFFYTYVAKLRFKYRFILANHYCRWGKLRSIKFLFLTLYLIIFLLMLKRRNTYTRRQFLKYFVIYFVLSSYFSSLLYYIFSLKFIVFGPIFAFILLYIKLN